MLYFSSTVCTGGVLHVIQVKFLMFNIKRNPEHFFMLKDMLGYIKACVKVSSLKMSMCVF